MRFAWQATFCRWRSILSRLHVRALTIALLAAAPCDGNAEVVQEVVDLQVRPEATQRMLVLKPDMPVATVLLFTGGEGRVEIDDAGEIRSGGNFLVRTRGRWAAWGFLTLVVDAPSDRHGSTGLDTYRLEAGHARDVAATIRYARGRANLPVWLIGTSRGTLSVVNAAAKIADDRPDGIVLTSSILRANKSRGSPVGDDVFDVDLAAIRMPVLIAHHREDACPVTPFDSVTSLAEKLVNARPLEVLAYEGGRPPISTPCEARAQHGYFGLEEHVVGDLARWIKARRR